MGKKRRRSRRITPPQMQSGHAQERGGRGRAYPLAFRLRVVEEVMSGRATIAKVAQAFGVCVTTVLTWVSAYEEGGVDTLAPRPSVTIKREPTLAERTKRDAVVELRQEHPEYGTRRIRDMLSRFEALGVSETQVRGILHEAGLIASRPVTPGREHGPRRFERAAPNQMWQSDIFTFLLRRHERLYLTAFMDDHSRFIVSTALAHHQRGTLVMEALGRGIAAYGTPEEVLTDQGRQYTAWRGETDFEQELRRQGVRHVKSRPQHPQTLGKVERFWKTLWEEFLSRTVFADFADCERRLGLFVDAYNFQRPHQGLGGLVPADRFFRSSQHVRAAIEASVKANAQRLALEQPARKPFYLVGRLGDRDLSISAAGSGLRVQVGDEKPQTIRLPKESSDEEVEAHVYQATAAEEDTQAKEAGNAAVAHVGHGARRDGQATLPSGAERTEWRARRDGGDRGGADLPSDVLPARGASAARDAGGSDPGRDRPWGERAREADRGAREASDSSRAGQAAERAAPPFDAQGDEGPDESGGRAPTEEPAACELDERWAQTLACLAEEEADAEYERVAFDPDAGWRDRSLIWDRKLATADASSEGPPPEANHGGKEGELHANARHTPGASESLCGGDRGAVRDDDGERGRAPAPSLAQSLPDADAPGARGDDRGARSKAGGTPLSAGAGAGAAQGERAASTRERSTLGADGDDRSTLGSGQRSSPGTGADQWANAADEGDQTDNETPVRGTTS
jgi:transposase InsO family protein